MSANYTGLFVNAYNSAYAQVPQEKKNPFDGTVQVVPITGENISFDDIGVATGKKKSTRFAKREVGDMTHRRRWISPEYYYANPILVDKQDNIALHSDPTSAYMQSITSWVERQKRDIVLASFEASVVAGKTPGAETAFSFTDTIYTAATGSGRTIVHDTTDSGAAGGVSTGLTEDKIMLAQQYFSDLGNPDGAQMYICCSYKQLRDLRKSALLQSIDTSDIKALMNRQIRTLMGVTFVVTNAITVGSSNDIDADTNIFPCYAWLEGGIKYAPFYAPKFNVWRNNEMVGEVWQIDCDFGASSVRAHEDMVLKIECANV
jgi:hypothetical protein